ncbi:dihydrofolate reductase [Francisellaceae bacterium]|nr:dihydrofolate reductase [Francisellaceae bacterium]
MKLSIIVAYDKNRGIGKNNTLPWCLKDDLKFFKETTANKPVIMGRKTYESIGRPLPNRRNIILSQQDLKIEGCEVYSDIKFALSQVQSVPEVFIIGGGNIYKQLISKVDALYITKVDTVVDADAFFPDWDEKKFELLSSKHFDKSEKNEFNFDIEIWKRIIF